MAASFVAVTLVAPVGSSPKSGNWGIFECGSGDTIGVGDRLTVLPI